MRDINVFSSARAMPRMSWNPRNLYNLWQRSYGEKKGTLDFRRSDKTLFQQRWAAKAIVRAYHGDYITEKSFKRWYLPETLPDVRPRRRVRGDDTLELAALAGRGRAAARELRKEEDDERHALAPVGSLMFGEVERRIDVFLFRCCFAHSAYEARRLIIHGDVLLNGKKHQNANTRLAPGDMITVNPTAIRFLQPSAAAAAGMPPGVASPRSARQAPEPKPSPEPEAEENADAPYPTLRTRIEEGAPKAEAPLTPFFLPKYASPWIFLPAYAEVNFPTCSAVYVRHPTARADYSEIPTPYDADGEVVRLAWEWYSRVRPRMRSKSQLARMPENRK